MTRLNMIPAIAFATLTTLATLVAVGSLALAGTTAPARAHPAVALAAGPAVPAAG